MVNRKHLMVGIMLATALAATGCAGKLRITSSKMCLAHGGTYNASAQTCSYPASTRSVKQTCEMQGGYYDPAAQVCEVGMD